MRIDLLVKHSYFSYLFKQNDKWYFYDETETWDAIGPFDNFSIASTIYTKYVYWLDNGVNL